jgi:hypothetical protein
LILHNEEREFHAQTDIADLCRISDEEVHSIVGMSMVAIAHLNLRVEEMRMHESISGFLPEELDLFGACTKYLIELQNSDVMDRQFRRIVSLMNLPMVPHTRGFDVERFIKVRDSPECIDFRNWIGTTELCSDEEIIARVSSLREVLSRYYQSAAGKAVRLLVSTGVGLLPGIRNGSRPRSRRARHILTGSHSAAIRGYLVHQLLVSFPI